jgi:hypothetical protein
MGLDIRVPLGLIFLILGAILLGFGLYSHADAALYARSLGVNLNLGWGGVMFAFGAAMLFVGRRQRWQDDPVNPRPWERPQQ